MKRLKRPRNNPGKEVPDNLLFTALRWETLREQYFTSIGRLDDAMEAHYLRRFTQNVFGTNTESPSTSNEI
jgi:hypothetical protein